MKRPGYSPVSAMLIVAIIGGLAGLTMSAMVPPLCQNPQEISEKLDQCLDAGTETFEFIHCFEVAHQAHRQNYSTQASLALALVRADMIMDALQAMDNARDNFFHAHEDALLEIAKEKGLTPEEGGQLEDLRNIYEHYHIHKNQQGKEDTIEIAIMIAKQHEIEHDVPAAERIIHGFLVQIGMPKKPLLDIWRRSGNLIRLGTHAELMEKGDATKTSVVFRVAESIPAIVERVTEHMMGIPGDRSGGVDDDGFEKLFCNMNIKLRDTVLVSEVLSNLDFCFENWGNFTTTLKAENPKRLTFRPYSMMDYKPVHRLAMLGAARPLELLLEAFPAESASEADRFGRNALQWATAYGQERTTKILLAAGFELDQKDSVRTTPRILGCASPLFLKPFEEMTKSRKTCDGHGYKRYEDQDIDLPDDSPSDGGWNPKQPPVRFARCDFDVRDASTVKAADLTLQYYQSGQPVLLRNAFYDTDGPAVDFNLKTFKKKFGNIVVRKETTPSAELYGMGTANRTTIADFIASSGDDDGTIANIHVDSKRSKLYDLTNWSPESFRTKTYSHENLMLDTSIGATLLTINKKGSSSIHRVRGFGSMHTVVRGLSDYLLLPPRLARTTRGRLSGSAADVALRCTLQTGDVLVVPDMWSLEHVSRRNGVTMEKMIVRDGTVSKSD